MRVAGARSARAREHYWTGCSHLIRSGVARPAVRTLRAFGSFHFYCPFAVTDALVFSVNVQVFRLRPLLEHASDQIASRPFETVSVTEVPLART